MAVIGLLESQMDVGNSSLDWHQLFPVNTQKSISEKLRWCEVFLERKLWKSHFKSCEFPSRISSTKTKKAESCCHQVAIRFCTWCTHFRSVPTPSTVVTDIPWQATNGFKPHFELMESQVGIVGFFAIKWWSMMIFESDVNIVIWIWFYMNIIYIWILSSCTIMIYLLKSANPHFPSGSNSDPAVERQLLTDR